MIQAVCTSPSNAYSAWLKGHLPQGTMALALFFVIAANLPPIGATSAQGRPRRVTEPTKKPKPQSKKPAPSKSNGQKPAPAKTEPLLSPAETLAQARAAENQNDRIKLLEKFLVAHRGSEQEAEARDLLIREYTLRAEQHLREGSPQLAAKDFQSTFRLLPSPITDRLFGQFVFPMPVAMSAFGFRGESVDLMRSFESRFADDPNRLIQIGFFYIQIEAPLEAIRVLEGVVQKTPDDHRAHNALGNAYLISLRLDDAEVEYRRALEINPRDEFANLSYANLLRGMGDYTKAVAYYRKQIAIKADDPEAQGGLAISFIALGRDEEAEAASARALELDPNNYHFLVQLAYYYSARKQAQLARPLIERALRIEPRYAWSHIVKANIDLLDGKHGDALSTLIAARSLASFPTLSFELVKTLMALDGYDQAWEIMGSTLQINDQGEYSTMLGGVLQARSPRLDLLLERERRASLFIHEQPTTALQFRLAEALGRIQHFVNVVAEAKYPPAKPKPEKRGAKAKATKPQAEDLTAVSRPRRLLPAEENSGELSAGADANLTGMPELLQAITTFTTLDDGRQPFRMVWVARQLAEKGIAFDAAEQLARRALALAEAATEPDGSMRDAPLLDREGRRLVFLGRVYDVLGWVLLKKGNIRAAMDSLIKSVQSYPPSLEAKGALWRLAVATEEAGDLQNALETYIAAYDPNAPTATARRVQIETLYKKLNGSLTGLEDKLQKK